MSFWGFGKSKEAANENSVDMDASRDFVAGSSFSHVDDVKSDSTVSTELKPNEKVDEEASNGKEKDDDSAKGRDDDVRHAWKRIDASEFNLRIGPNYKKTGAKAPSGPSLYELVGLDVIQCPKRIDDIAEKVKFPEDWTTITSNHPHVPPVFIINAQLPSTFETSLFSEISDGDGWSLVHYFRIRPEVAEQLKDVAAASPAVKLLAQYCEQAPAEQKNSYSTWFGRFKLILRCENIKEFGLPSFITSYNGKPVLIRNTGTVTVKKDYADMTINVHRFSSMPKKGLSMLMGRFDKMDISTAFCIEGRVDEEMPEVILGCARIHKPDYKKAPHWGDLPLKA